MHEVLEGLKDGTETTLINLDQSKTFNRVDHWSLLTVFETAGLKPEFRKWIIMMYHTSQSVVQVNEKRSEAFSIERLVWWILEVWFRPGPQLERNWSEVQTKVDAEVGTWLRRRLSFKNRVDVCAVYIFLVILYRLFVFSLLGTSTISLQIALGKHNPDGS